MTSDTPLHRRSRDATHRKDKAREAEFVGSQPDDNDAARQNWRNAVDLRKHTAIQSLIKGETCHQAMSRILTLIESALQGSHACVMKLSDDGKQLHVFSALSLTEAFQDLLVNISRSTNGSLCMEAIKHQRPVYTDDVRSLPYWCDMPVDRLPDNVVSQWSCPLKTDGAGVTGTLTIFFDSRNVPGPEDLACLQQDADTLAMIHGHTDRIEQLERQNRALSISLSDKQQTIDDTNALLDRAIQQRNELRSTLLEAENLSSFDTMLASLTHEMNTPIGVSITAVSHLKALLQQVREAFEQDQLRRSQLDNFLRDCAESSEIIERNLTRSTNLITTFKQLSTDQRDETTRPIVLSQHIDELLMSLKPKIKSRHPQYCIDMNCDLVIHSNPGALSQVLVNLIMNSHDHGFEDRDKGRIWISARVVDNTLMLTYQDNGKGMDEATVASIYKPFFTLARLSGGTGLGLHICYNLIVRVLGGSIDCESSPGQGTTFSISIPLAPDN